MPTPDLFSLQGRRALVTGGSRGIGLTIARGLAAHGARVILNGRSSDTLDAARAALRADGFEADAVAFDVTDQSAVSDAVSRIEREQGPIDILVNNAGLQRRAPLEDFTRADWDTLLSTNISAVFFAAQAVARHMLGRGRGKIINICSVQSELARPNIAPYTATKGAVRNLTRGMATDWAKHGLQINGLAPGYFETEMNDALVRDAAFTDWLCKRTPAARWGRVEELVGAAVFLASDASSFVNGHMLTVDGGISISL
ncbi:SDR family oxidoreductase [Acetobacteraceae bacterium KSS8]|uniref:SDR family oxidoreductase n=1 Tax=Endosaccharibacter trunci TaxID=2812733 RepID=A0ABT1W450_9PROT|nr:SDR family oxidoreductase [Acetobacteraceae bacterium KSS8]